jgi:hypothetical protein
MQHAREIFDPGGGSRASQDRRASGASDRAQFIDRLDKRLLEPPDLQGRLGLTRKVEHYVRGMDEVGLLPAVESSPPYVSGETWQQVSEQFCKGSMEDWGVVHYHFFDAGGSFGSLNQNEEQVDDGTYTILDAHTFKIGRSKFRYTVRGNTMTIDPVLTGAQREEALAKPGEFTDAVWMAAVAVPGTSWTRVDCDGWC